MEALGFLETKGRIGAIIVTDAALKAADVRLISLKRVSGGLVTVIIEGKIAAVNEAIESAKKQACIVSCDLLTSTIPRPAAETIELVNKHTRLTPEILKRSRK
ncbi:MAG: BMC domain-containing protein [Candidatus Hodarchaeales archaeon]